MEGMWLEVGDAKYKRVLLKLSGEAMAGNDKTGINIEVVGNICDKIKEVISFASKYLQDKYNKKPTIVYGGSVDSSNIKEILNIDNVDGVLIGNRSSNVKEVERMINNIE